MKEFAKEHNMCLSYIPAGQTGYSQPLDGQIFGIVKKKSQAQFEQLTARKPLTEIDIIDTIVTVVNVWNSLDKESIVSAWRHFVTE